MSVLACRNSILEIDEDLPDRSGLITVTGLVAADSAWRIDVYSSKNILDSQEVYGFGATDIQPVTNAIVVIRENGQFHDNLVYSLDSFIRNVWAYRSSKPEIHPTPGKTYDIEVTVPNVGTATSTGFIPIPVKITSVVAKREMSEISTQVIHGSRKDPLSSQAVPVEIVIDDPAGENYYEMFVKFVDNDFSFPINAMYLYTKNMQFHNTGATSSGKLINAPGDLELYSTVLFRDNDTQAKQLKLSAMMPVLTQLENNELVLRTDLEYQVVLRTISKEYFQYAASRELQANSYDNPFAQPVIVYGNIKNGLGIFAPYSEYGKNAEFK